MIFIMQALMNFAREKPMNFKVKFFWEGLPGAKILGYKPFQWQKYCVLNMITSSNNWMLHDDDLPMDWFDSNHSPKKPKIHNHIFQNTQVTSNKTEQIF